jgi:hypothetical protein
MIVRIWHGWTTPESADVYQDLLKTHVFPGILAKNVAGLDRIELVRRVDGDEVEFITMMWFDTLDAVRDFVGADYESAYVPDAARKVLKRFDARSAHYEAQWTEAARKPASCCTCGAPAFANRAQQRKEGVSAVAADCGTKLAWISRSTLPIVTRPPPSASARRAWLRSAAGVGPERLARDGPPDDGGCGRRQVRPTLEGGAAGARLPVRLPARHRHAAADRPRGSALRPGDEADA